MFDPTNIDLTSADFSLRDAICFLNSETKEYDGRLGARISSIFVIFAVSTTVTLFPVLAKRMPRLRIPLSAYNFARFFGAGVIIATAFIHLLDPAYEELGPASCVGLTGAWAEFSWVPAIVLSSIMAIFLVELAAARYVEMKYGVRDDAANLEALITDGLAVRRPEKRDADEDDEGQARMSFEQQFAAFLILEFGIIFHSVIIGMNLGVAAEEFATLYIVLVFHQSFEGLGIGARLSSIPFPKPYSWAPYALCLAYGLTTPASIAIGLGLRTSYDPGSFTASVVSGVLDSISAGILIYTGLVELLARDFLFDPKVTRNARALGFKVGSMMLGAGVMAVLGKWA